jgi:hypothetical protein
MARHDGQQRVWPWVLAAFAGILTTAGGSPGYEMLGSLTAAGAIAMIVLAVRRNRAARRAALAAANQAARAGKKQAAATRHRKPGTGRRAARKVITLLP